MGYKFRCGGCGREILVKWLKPGEAALCRRCGHKMPVPAKAQEIDNALVDEDSPEPEAASTAPSPARPGCPGCRYFKAAGAGRAGACHRYPPGAGGGYPEVTDADWCGERAEKY
jgi:DNA-directed RNA polymerase subunit RPC12/RpoP